MKKKLSSKYQKVGWLLTRKRLWESIPCRDDQFWTFEQEAAARNLVSALQEAGLVSPATYWLDVNVRELVKAVRIRLRMTED